MHSTSRLLFAVAILGSAGCSLDNELKPNNDGVSGVDTDIVPVTTTGTPTTTTGTPPWITTSGSGTPGGTPNPGTPSGTPNPGTPVGTPNPGTPVGTPNPGTPVGTPNPGTPVGTPNPGTPVGNPNPGTPVGNPNPGTPVGTPATGTPVGYYTVPTSGVPVGTWTGTFGVTADTSNWTACNWADHVAGFLDPYQTPNDGRVLYCHSTAANQWNFVNSNISSCLPHINHPGDIFPTTICDS